MSQDGFGTLSAGLVDRGNRRLDGVLTGAEGGEAAPPPPPSDAAARAFDTRTGTKPPARPAEQTEPPALVAMDGNPRLVAFGSATYKRRTLREIEREREEHLRNRPEVAWINTPTYQGPDRRHNQVSPVIERRKTVAPRVKVTVRLEQERYLRLKLASHDLDRTQQDLMTAALDTYLDQFQVDRFQRDTQKKTAAPSKTESRLRAMFLGRKAG